MKQTARPSRYDVSRNEDLTSGYNRPLARVADIVWLESAEETKNGGDEYGSRCSGNGSAERSMEDDNQDLHHGRTADADRDHLLPHFSFQNDPKRRQLKCAN